MIRSKVAIVGVGKIGKHHLQALLHIQRSLDIYLVDPSQESFNQTKIVHTHNIVKCFHISSLPPELDVVIVATTADIRKEIVKHVLSSKKIKHLILEKVVFQQPEDFIEINKLLIERQVKAWVNCPLRMLPFFQSLQQKTSHSSERLNYQVSGSLWNLASNAIHHLDLFAFLTGDFNPLLDATLLDLDTITTKRDGFIEFTGTLQGRTTNGSTIILTSYKENHLPLFTQISTLHGRSILMQKEGKVWTSDETSGWKWKEQIIPYQSQLTHIVVQQLLETGTCKLTPFEQSCKVHIPFLDALINHLQKQTSRRVHVCPIT